jgi:hypothetical protein
MMMVTTAVMGRNVATILLGRKQERQSVFLCGREVVMGRDWGARGGCKRGVQERYPAVICTQTDVPD